MRPLRQFRPLVRPLVRSSADNTMPIAPRARLELRWFPEVTGRLRERRMRFSLYDGLVDSLTISSGEICQSLAFVRGSHGLFGWW
jgi:hypothetical protein